MRHRDEENPVHAVVTMFKVGPLLPGADYFEPRLIARGVRLLADFRCSLGFAFIGRALSSWPRWSWGKCLCQPEWSSGCRLVSLALHPCPAL